jgi:hypothetical protein
VIPFTAPDKTVFFEDVNNAMWNDITIWNHFAFISAFTIPLPIMRVLGINVHCDAKTVKADAIGSGDIAPIECSTDI